MRRVGTVIVVCLAIVGLIFLLSRLSYPLMVHAGRTMTGQARMGQMHGNMESEQQHMRQQLEGMMSRMQEMAAPSASFEDDRSGMMQSMNSMDETVQQMLERMDGMIANRTIMAKPQFKANMESMQQHLQAIMNSMEGMLGNIDQMQKSPQELN